MKCLESNVVIFEDNWDEFRCEASIRPGSLIMPKLCWGFDANKKKSTQPRISQDLSISNVVTITWRFGDIPL
jgi:hypothetical protein